MLRIYGDMTLAFKYDLTHINFGGRYVKHDHI